MNQPNETNTDTGAANSDGKLMNRTDTITRGEADRQYEQVMAFFQKREPQLLKP